MRRKRSILGGLLGSWCANRGPQEAPAEPQSESPADSTAIAERRAAPRVPLDDDDGVVVLVEGVQYPVRNMSLRGLALHVPPGCELPPSPWDATLVVADERVTAKLQLAHDQGRWVGCSVEDPEPRWHEVVQAVLDPLMLGNQLREINPRFVEPDRRGHAVRWFQGGSSCDLFLWHTPQEGQFVAAQLFFMDLVVEWTPEHGVRTGVVDAMVRGHNVPAADLFNLRSPPDGQAVSVAHRILRAAKLPDEVRAVLCTQSG